MSERGKSVEKDTEEEEETKDLKDFPESFNQLELLETHRDLIPRGTQSLWSGESDDEDQDEKTEEWYQAQERKLENNPDKLLLWAAEKNRVSHLERSLFGLCFYIKKKKTKNLLQHS